ncbi:MAG: efflux RND transporter periplasmic adaptor subunit [Desulfovibrionaceae bacterium]
MEIQIKKRSRFIPILFSLLFIIGISCGIYFLYFQKNADPLTVLVLEKEIVHKGIVEDALDATGIIKPTIGSLITVSTQVSGLIDTLFVTVGKEIKKGTPLIKIDNKALEIKKQELTATLQKAQANLDTLRTLYPIHLSEAENAVLLAEQQILLAKNSKKRSDKRNPSEEEKEQYDHTILESTLALSTAKSQKEKVEKEFLLQEKASKASVSQIQYQLNTLLNENSYYSITSPINGVVGNIFVQVGEYITTSSKVATIVNPSQMEMWVYIDENDITLVKKATQLSFTVDSLPNTLFTGNITHIYPEPELRNGVVYYKAVVPIKKEYIHNLYLEMTTQVYIITGKQDNVLRIPNTAVKWIDSKQVVYVEKDGAFIPYNVLLGKKGNTHSEVLSGLDEGDTIATKIELHSEK